ncbi:hypothetical protein HMN09_00228500 [Mycena chlorophos]|uniref:FAD/NAD(P)-binding domain-containing protein n=1 Tax=Mycena chlorophos TaxID=658473 RepID=A0A8H6TLJ3_MYCCL|nr:hypothetical protein HMN09_00228500 [Mycena chlorophos]
MMATIGIIGGGAGGLAALKAILDTPEFKSGTWKPMLFEAQTTIGGIWHSDDACPLYESLTTNLPNPVMCFQSYPFPSSTPIFPAAAYVQRYLEAYAAHFSLMPHIRLGEKVTDLRWDAQSSHWIVTLQSSTIHHFDRVVIANGHHSVPRYPKIPGLQTWLDAKRASHSVSYRRPEPFGNKVLIVGGGPSANDISAELAKFCTIVRSMTDGSNKEENGVIIRGRTVGFGDFAGGEVFFEDGSVEKDVDYCILATGYEVSVPFLQMKTGLPPCPPLPSTLYNSTAHIFPLARLIFPIQEEFPPSTLAFVGLPVRVAPLPVMEAQSAAIVRVFREASALDIAKESQKILARFTEMSERLGSPAAVAKQWSVFTEPEQWAYQDALFAFAGSDERVPQWRKDMYAAKTLLRTFWVDLERRGDADEWVKDVHGMDAWVAVLQRLLESAREWESTR